MIVAIQRYEGDPIQLREQYEHANAILRDRGPAKGALLHLCFQTDDGICLLNVWRSTADQRKAAERADFRSALAAVGMAYVAPTIHPLMRMSAHAPQAAQQGETSA